MSSPCRCRFTRSELIREKDKRVDQVSRNTASSSSSSCSSSSSTTNKFSKSPEFIVFYNETEEVWFCSECQHRLNLHGELSHEICEGNKKLKTQEQQNNNSTSKNNNNVIATEEEEAEEQQEEEYQDDEDDSNKVLGCEGFGDASAAANSTTAKKEEEQEVPKSDQKILCSVGNQHVYEYTF